MTFSDIICQEQETESCRVHSLAHDYFKDTEAQNKRDEESRIDLTEPSMWIQMIMKDETCQRCGGLLNWAYILNDRVLCRKCMNEEQGNWDIVSGEFLDSKMDLRIKSIKAKSALKSFYSWLLGLIGVKKKHSKEPIYVWPRTKRLKTKKIHANQNDLHRMPKYEGAMRRSKEIFHMKWIKARLMKLKILKTS